MSQRPRLSTYVSYQLELVSHAARATADAVYRRECGVDIRRLRVMRVVAETPGATVSQVVEVALSERTVVSRLIGELSKSGMLIRRICEEDARQTRLFLTDKGRDVVETANRIGDALNEDLLSVLDPEERVVFDACLEKLTKWRPGSALWSPKNSRNIVTGGVG